MNVFYNLTESKEIFNKEIKIALGFNSMDDYTNSLLYAYNFILSSDYEKETKSDLLILVASWIRNNTADKTKQDLKDSINSL